MTKQQIKFRSLRKKGYTLAEIGKKYKLSAERVRQICNPVKLNRCIKHKIFFEKVCTYCWILEVYPNVINKILKDKKAIVQEFERLLQQDRTKAVVIQRSLLIKAMRDNLQMSFFRISKTLQRDYSSIRNLYLKDL